MRQITTLILIIHLLNFYELAIGQTNMNNSSECYKIQFVLKNSSPSDSTLVPIFQEHGFHLIEDGVYDFIINGKKYFQSYLYKISNSRFSISQNWTIKNNNVKLADTLVFSSNEMIEIRLLTINNGVGGLPFTVGRNYNVNFIKSDKLCKMQYANIDTDKEFDGLFYFTGYGWKKIKMKKGKPYLCEVTGQYKLRRR